MAREGTTQNGMGQVGGLTGQGVQCRDQVYRFFSDKTDLFTIHPMEATYLAWIDCRRLPVQDPARFFEEHGVGLSDGEPFGDPGWLRLNFGCPPDWLAAALERMEAAVGSL